MFAAADVVLVVAAVDIIPDDVVVFNCSLRCG